MKGSASRDDALTIAEKAHDEVAMARAYNASGIVLDAQGTKTTGGVAAVNDGVLRNNGTVLVEVHGSIETSSCTQCGATYDLDAATAPGPSSACSDSAPPPGCWRR